MAYNLADKDQCNNIFMLEDLKNSIVEKKAKNVQIMINI